jgi:hypothetical protein
LSSLVIQTKFGRAPSGPFATACLCANASNPQAPAIAALAPKDCFKKSRLFIITPTEMKFDFTKISQDNKYVTKIQS